MHLRALFLRAEGPPSFLPRFKLRHWPSHLFLVQWPLIYRHLRRRRPDPGLDLARTLHPFVDARAPCRQRGLHPLSLPPLVRVKLVSVWPRAGPDGRLGGR